MSTSATAPRAPARAQPLPGAEAVISDESLDLRWFGVEALPDGVDAGLLQLVTAARCRWSSGFRSPE